MDLVGVVKWVKERVFRLRPSTFFIILPVHLTWRFEHHYLHLVPCCGSLITHNWTWQGWSASHESISGLCREVCLSLVLPFFYLIFHWPVFSVSSALTLLISVNFRLRILFPCLHFCLSSHSFPTPPFLFSVLLNLTCCHFAFSRFLCFPGYRGEEHLWDQVPWWKFSTLVLAVHWLANRTNSGLPPSSLNQSQSGSWCWCCTKKIFLWIHGLEAFTNVG